MELNPENQVSFFKKVWLVGAFIIFFILFIMPFHEAQLFQNVYFRFWTLKFKCNFLKVSLVS